MQARGTVIALQPQGLALVSVPRGSACGHDCTTACDGCGQPEQLLTVSAENRCRAEVGDPVWVHTPSQLVIGLAFGLYLVPLLAFLGGYGIAPWLGACGFAITLALVVLYGRLVLPRKRCVSWLSKG